MASKADAPRGPAPGRLTEEELLSAMPARTGGREVRVGLFVLLGLIAFFAALFTFTDVGTFRGRYYLNTVVQNAGGMRRGDPVQMRGVNIGRVVEFQMVPEGVAVRMELYDEYRVPEHSRAEISSSGLLGGMTVSIIPGPGNNPVESGDTIPGISAPGIMGTATELGDKAETVLARVNTLLAPSTTAAVNQSARELQTLLAEMNALVREQRAQLTALESSLRTSASNAEQATAGAAKITNSPELQRAIARLDETSTNLSQASQGLNKLLSRINSGQGTLGKLATDEELYRNLNSAAANLDSLLADIKANPGRYINVKVF